MPPTAEAPLPTESHASLGTAPLAVFDLDGTLIDSRRDLADSANAMLAAYGARPLSERQIVAMVGCGAATLVKRVITTAGVNVPPAEALERFLAVYDERLTRFTRPYEGVPELLQELRAASVRLAILTNKPLAQTTKILDEFRFANYFDWVVGGDGPWPRKPAPDGLSHIVARAGAAADDAMLVGDSLVDLQTARSAGVRICLARYGFGFADIPAEELRGGEAIVDRPAEIAGCLYARR